MAISVGQAYILFLVLAVDVVAGGENFWEEQKTSWCPGHLQISSGVCREAGNRTVLPAKLLGCQLG